VVLNWAADRGGGLCAIGLGDAEMNDRELMELAAKAIHARPDDVAADGTHCFGCSRWNPLNDDGDALRLAVKLQLQITPGTYNKDEFSAFHAGRGEAIEHWSTMQDEYAATRRAIVRAAAEIGKAMP